jgi:hypothetical protein
MNPDASAVLTSADGSAVYHTPDLYGPKNIHRIALEMYGAGPLNVYYSNTGDNEGNATFGATPDRIWSWDGPGEDVQDFIMLNPKFRFVKFGSTVGFKLTSYFLDDNKKYGLLDSLGAEILGKTTDEPAADGNIIQAIKLIATAIATEAMKIVGADGLTPASAANPLNSDIAPLSSSIDSIDAAKRGKGTADTVLTTATTSGIIVCQGHNDLLVEVSGDGVFTLTGTLVSGGTYRNVYKRIEDGTLVQHVYTNASGVGIIFDFRGVPDFCKITSSTAVIVKVQPCNLG